MVDKRASERATLRQKMADMAQAAGMSLDALFGKGREGKGSVAAKYRDPKNPENTWTGRGRMPLWMVAATKGNKAKKEDFLN
jgi:DNA-binding protein H-NS